MIKKRGRGIRIKSRTKAVIRCRWPFAKTDFLNELTLSFVSLKRSLPIKSPEVKRLKATQRGQEGAITLKIQNKGRKAKKSA